MDMPAEKPRLLTQVNGRMRARHLSPRTVQAYVGWIIRYIRYHGTRHPSELGETEIRRVSHLPGGGAACVAVDADAGAQCAGAVVS